MASPEPSPKRQRLSPSGDHSPSFATASGADSAYGSSTASQVNGIISNAVATTSTAPASSLPSIPESQLVESETSTTKVDNEPSPAVKAEDSEMEVTRDHRQTNHEREGGDGPSATENLPFLCKKTYSKSRPHPTQNLVGLYSLSSLAATVARRDPVTGAKINKLRKSYEGKVKKQDLPGRNKPTVLEGELMGFMEWPEEGWYDQRIYGRELEHALDPVKGRLWRTDDGPTTKVERALQFNTGRLPRDEDEKWRATLALDEPLVTATKSGPPKSAQHASGAVNGLLKPGLNTGMRASAPASPAIRSPGSGAGSAATGADRPDRAGKKRRYDDASFEGYEAAGWAEDDGYSTGGGDAAKRGKRRREPAPVATASQSTSTVDARGLSSTASGSGSRFDGPAAPQGNMLSVRGT